MVLGLVRKYHYHHPVFVQTFHMKRNLIFTLLFLSLGAASWAQTFKRPYEDRRRVYVEVGAGAGLLKANRAYTLSPLFLNPLEVGVQFFAAPQVIVTERLNLGILLGGVFRPKYNDIESNSILETKFTPYAAVMGDYYFGAPRFKPTSRFFVGMATGISYIGKLEARDNITEESYFFRRRDRDFFYTIMPRFGVSFRDVKIQIEHVVTMPFNPDFTSITISTMVPVGKPTFYYR